MGHQTPANKSLRDNTSGSDNVSHGVYTVFPPGFLQWVSASSQTTANLGPAHVQRPPPTQRGEKHAKLTDLCVFQPHFYNTQGGPKSCQAWSCYIYASSYMGLMRRTSVLRPPRAFWELYHGAKTYSLFKLTCRLTFRKITASTYICSQGIALAAESFPTCRPTVLTLIRIPLRVKTLWLLW